jgi:hypothetical protein
MPQQDGPDWTFRSIDHPEASFEFRITGTPTGTTWQVNGFIRGSITISTAPDVTADFGKLGVIAGTTDARQASGELHGQVRFADTQGNALTCTNVRWAFIRE